MTHLEGRVAVVTGAASGMGRVMARAFSSAGAQVAGLDLSAAEDPLAFELLADLANPQDCERAVNTVVARLGRLDILVNCGGVSMGPAAGGAASRVPLHEAVISGYLQVLQVNLLGSTSMAYHAARAMVPSGWGRIINVTTRFDTMLASGLSAYGASKAALEASTASWAKDLAGTGVTCNVLVPGGPTDTPFFPGNGPRPPRMISPEVMAGPVVWLASCEADSVTGARIVAADWDPVRPVERLEPAAWPALAQAAASRRGSQP